MIELIIPSNPYLDDETRNPPLGLLYIAAFMEKLGYPVHITDLRGKQVTDFQLEDADIYGVTAASPDYLLSLEIARIIKAKKPQSWTVLGGVHASSVPQQIGPEFDKVVVGEGELAFQQVVQDFYNDVQDRRYYESGYIEDLDSIPFPAMHLLPSEALFSKNAVHMGGECTGAIITSRGCPHHCSFCSSNTMWGRKVRFRSPQNVVAEIEHIIREYGITTFRFHDDTMTLNRYRFEELCKLLAPLGIQWRANARVDTSNLETLQMMKKSGCIQVGYGIESLSQKVLDKCHKGTTLQDIHLALRNVKLAELECRLFFIIGLPGEPLGFANRLEEFLEIHDPDGVNLLTFVPYPGSSVFYHPEQYDIVLKEVPLDQFIMALGLKGNEAEQPLTFVHDVMTEEQIINERKKALRVIQKRDLVKNF